jgi:methylenetetrahydrofolate dehydrogenase (NADP+)/methenyltetrahydrofolate cyclohydrolase
MKIIDGKKIAHEILEELKKKIDKSEAVPGLAVVLIGNDSASELYVNLKEKASREVGMNFYKFTFSEDEEEENIIQKIEELNNDKKIHGIIVQLPLPEKFDTDKIINSIDCEKDADGFREDSFCKDPVFPRAIMRMIESVASEKENSLVIAKSRKFGEIMTKMLEKKKIKSEYVLCGEIESKNLNSYDAIVTACGIPNLINNSMVRNDAVIIDGGIRKVDGKTLGDLDFLSFKNTNCYVSPVPGGVGPVTVACLLESVYRLSENNRF